MIKIAFQGARGAFSHRAAQIFVERMQNNEQVEPVSCRTFDEMFNTVTQDKADFAAVPLENSSVGSIVANYDLLWKVPVAIVGEVYVPVHHNLLVLPGTKLEQIREIYSHPVALDQVRKFLATVPQAKAVSFWDTSGSAFHVKETGNPAFAAVASELAAKEAGLEILARDIEDHSTNNTRFGIITPESKTNGISGPRKDALEMLKNCDSYKMTCSLELKHEPGSLAKLLDELASVNVNLTKIESRPNPDTPWHYRFFLDLELKRADDDRIASALKSHSIRHKILGRYPIATQ